MEYSPRRKLSREFKLEAVRQAALSEKPKAQLARELGVRVGQLRTWRLEFEKGGDRHMEVFYNRQRRHSSISYEAPLPFEAMKSPGKVSTVRG
jgi:transposase-like protein